MDLESRLVIPEMLQQATRRLDKHYILTRYPNGFDAGAPYEFYTADEARQAIQDAERIYEFCQQSFR